MISSDRDWPKSQTSGSQIQLGRVVEAGMGDVVAQELVVMAAVMDPCTAVAIREYTVSSAGLAGQMLSHVRRA